VQDKRRQVIIRALQDEDPEVCRAASQALGHLEACADMSALRAALQSTDRRQRIAAVYTLGHLPAPEAGALLLECLQDQDVDVRAVAVQMAGVRREKSALSALVRCLKDSAPAVAVHAARALARFEDKRLVPYLQAMCASTVEELVCACLDTLGELGDSSALDTGIRAATHPDPAVRLSAIRMLGRLG